MPVSFPSPRGFRARIVASAIAFVAFVALAPATAEPATVLVLDASGSMWAQLPEGRSRIEVARDVLGEFLRSRDPSGPLGVVAYGHNRRGDCSDIETIASVVPQDGAALAVRLRGLSPKGKTPLGQSLRRAAALLPATAEEADIVLVTDGLETCGVDPCAVAAELAASGIAIRAHIVGFGLTEGEVAQLACVPEQTGGLLITAASGAELADALTRTAERPSLEPQAPGRAALELSIRASNAGRPDAVRFTATSAAGETRELGMLDFASGAAALPVELEEGAWLLQALTDGRGEGELSVAVVAGEARTIYVPFTGLYPDVVLDDRGPYEAGVSAAVPFEITNEGLATGGADFLIGILPVSERDRTVASLYDRELITWHYQDGSVGARVAGVSMPSEPGTYLMSFYRDGDDPVADSLVLHEITVVARPDVLLDAPPRANPGALLPIVTRGGQTGSDRVEIWRDGAAVSWDYSRYLASLLGDGGAPDPLSAPQEPGLYEIVYVRANAADGEPPAARQPLEVLAGDLAAEEPDPRLPAGGAPEQRGDAAPLDPATGPDAAPSDFAAAYACDGPVPCRITDAASGIGFLLPAGWQAEAPFVAPWTAGGEAVARVAFRRPLEVPDAVALNPRQWTGGDCVEIAAGTLCRNDMVDPVGLAGFEILRATLTTPAALSVPAAAAGADAPISSNEILRRCLADAPCTFHQPNLRLAGWLPPGWAVEVAMRRPDGRIATWFTDRDPAGNDKRLGLNQPDGEACLETALGPLCEHTPYISTGEAALVARHLTDGGPEALLAPVSADETLDADRLRDIGVRLGLGARD